MRKLVQHQEAASENRGGWEPRYVIISMLINSSCARTCARKEHDDRVIINSLVPKYSPMGTIKQYSLYNLLSVMPNEHCANTS